MKCKYYLILGSDKIDPSKAECMDVSEMITNLDDIKMSYTRADLGGIVRKISSEIQLCGDARDSIVDYYSANMLASVGAFGVYRIKNDWSYEPLFECPLDFASFSYDSYLAKIGCVDNSASAVIKANKNVKYEIPVSEIKEPHRLLFDGIRLKNIANIYPAGESVEGQEYTTTVHDCTGYYKYMPPMYFSDDSVVMNKRVLLSDQKETHGSKLRGGTTPPAPNYEINSYFLTALEDVELKIDISRLMILAYDFSVMGNFVEYEFGRIAADTSTCNYVTPIIPDKGRIFLKKGEKLQLAVQKPHMPPIGGVDPGYLSFYNCTFRFWGQIAISWQDVADPIDVNVIKPVTLLNRIIQNMGLKDVTCEIANNALIERTMIVASESIRDFKDAKLYTSFSKFCDYMEAVYGYVYQVQDNKVRFVHRSSVFQDNLVKTLNVISEPTYKVAADRIYSDIEIGYVKQDYDLGNNGKDEYNFTNYYSTGLNLKSRKLKLISPYRADGYGFQEQAKKRLNQDEQDKSDSNTFIVNISNPDTTDKYLLDRSLNIEGTYTDSVFNAAFNPRAMVQNNIGYLSSFCREMKFTASDGNADAVIGGSPLNGNITMTEPLFRAGELTIKTNDMILPREWNGYISFKWGEKTFNCYLKGMDLSIIQNEVLEYEVLDYELIER